MMKPSRRTNILKNAKGWRGNSDRVAILGKSAGGIVARDQKLTPPVAIVAVCPVATTSTATLRKLEEAAAKPLNTPMMAWFLDKVMIAWFFDKVLNNDGENQDLSGGGTT
jgi:acetyl esterase/lipase